jgi:CheY-like chemotaxis protein
MSIRKKILVVDDEPNITTFLKTYLEETGKYEVHAENLGSKGLESARLWRPDLILLDIMMKDMNGDAFANQAKSDPILRKTPIVFLTGIVTKEEVNASGGVIGGYPYIAKPILALQELVSCIEANTS